MAAGKKTGGRIAGTPNKATREIKEIAQAYGAEAIEGLWKLAKGAESEQARVSAYKEVLDRGYGKPGQSIGLGQAEDLKPLETIERPPISRDAWLAIHGAKNAK